MGDFNIDLLKFESHSATDGFLNTLGSNFFQPYILQPTRITDHSATLIDKIFLNSIEHFTISGNIVHDLSDHLPNFLIFNKFSSLPCNVKIFKRDYSKFDQQALISEIQLIDWETIFVPNDSACNMFKSFYSKISSIINKHIPVKQLSRREIKLKSKPWISKALRKSIQIKNNYYKKYLKTKSTYYHTKFKLYRNKLNHLLKISKKQYYNEYFFQNIKDGKRIWKGIKQIVKIKPQTSQRLIKIVDNNLEITEPKLVANAFNNYFANIGRNLESEILSVSNSPMEYLNNPV